MLTERKLTERELDNRKVVLQGLLKNKQNLVKKYGKDAEKVMYGIATKKAKSKVESMNKEKIKELINQALTTEERAADRYNVNVFGYQTQYYRVCPAAKAFMDKVVDGGYGDLSDRKNEVIRMAKLNDLLFKKELRAVEDANYAKKIVTSGEVEYIADTIKDMAENLGIPKADVDYIDNHVKIIFDAQSGIKEDNDPSGADLEGDPNEYVVGEGHGLDQGDLDLLKQFVDSMGFDREPVKAEDFSKLKKILQFIIKSNILQDKTKDLSKGKVNENASQDNAVMELRNIIDELEEKAEEAREIIRQYFPNELSRLDAYGVFDVAYSGNRYNVTLGKFVDRLEEGDYDDLDDDDYVNEEVSSANFAKGIDVIKATLSKEGGAAGLEPLVKELVKLGFKKDEVVDLLSKMTSVKKHRDGDYILLPLEEKELSKSEQNSLKKIEKALRKASKSHKSQSSALAKSTTAHKLQADKIAKIVREKLTKRSDVGDFMDDFKKSKAKQFRGKSAKKKKEMAVAAYLAKQNDE